MTAKFRTREFALKVGNRIEEAREAGPYLLDQLLVRQALLSLLLRDSVEDRRDLLLSVAVGPVVCAPHYTIQQFQIVTPNLG